MLVYGNANRRIVKPKEDRSQINTGRVLASLVSPVMFAVHEKLIQLLRDEDCAIIMFYSGLYV